MLFRSFLASKTVVNDDIRKACENLQSGEVVLNIFDCTRHYDDLAHALLPICAKVTLVAFSGDMLFPPSCMREMHETLRSIGKACDYHEIDSDYGHDAFLVEVDKFEKIIKKVLDE